MIPIHLGLAHARPMLSFEADRLQVLVDDLRRIATGASPTADVLDDAPVTDGWSFGRRAAPVITGHTVGHPRLPDGPVVTSEVIALDLDAGWARTLSRFYVLGRPAGGSHV